MKGGMSHKHVVPLTISTAMIAYGALQQFYPLWGSWNWVIAGVVTFLVAGLWHDSMCKMGK